MTNALTFEDSAPQWGCYLSDYLKTREGIHKTGEFIVHALDWAMPQFEGAALVFAGQARADLKGITSSLSIPEFFENVFQFAGRLNQTSYQVQVLPADYVDLTFDGLAVFNSGCDSALFLDSKKFIDLKGNTPLVEGFFWGSLLVMGGIDFYNQVGSVDSYQEKIKEETLPAHTSYYQRQADITNARVVKAVVTVAMAALALISFVYGNLAEGVMLLPTLFLGLSTAYVLLSIMIYFNERLAEESAPPGLKV